MPKFAQLRTAIYARVSTLDQDPRMQLQELRAYTEHRGLPGTEAFIDDVTGATAERRQLDRLWQAVRARKVDAVLVWKFDRFARSTKQLIDALEECRHLVVAFIAITEQIDTASPVGKAMFTVNSAIAEFERSLISERFRAGIAKAPANGKPHGRPTTDEQTIQEIRRRRRQGERLNAIARHLGVSHQTVANCAPQEETSPGTDNGNPSLIVEGTWPKFCPSIPQSHLAWTNEETIVQLHGVGSWAITYVNPADDPRKP